MGLADEKPTLLQGYTTETFLARPSLKAVIYGMSE